ncbi:MAG: glutathione S-transferase [Pseudomonadota bacterium]|nr:glutathione S-transferase [Pseudomonadota bacterium]
MMMLRSSSASPFARKIRIAAAVLGFSDRIEVAPADTSDPADPLRAQNPLGKIPTLVLADGRAIYDSAVILEYLDFLAGGGKLIPAGEARFDALTRAALADGVADAAILTIYEQRWRDAATHSARWLDHQSGKIARALAAFEAAAPDPARVDVAGIALACALGYLDLRFGGKWRAGHPGLVAWLDGFAAQVPAFEATRHREG